MNWRTKNSYVLRRGKCDAPGCRSSDAKHHYSDGHAFCFSCGTFFPPEGGKPEFRQRPKDDEDMTVLHAYPNRLEVNALNCPRNYAHLKLKGLTDEEIHEHYFYAPISDRHVFQCKDSESGDEFFEARSYVPNITPKTMQMGKKPRLVMGDLASDTLVVVEDVISAIKVGRQYLSMPLFGSHMTTEQMALIGRLTDINWVVIWLDCDKYDAGIQFARQMGLIRPCVAIQTIDDPKELNDDEVAHEVESAVDALEVA